MIPRAKKNLHECEFHIRGMENARHFEELEISFLALVRAARNVTWVLASEFENHRDFSSIFKEWFGDKDKPAVDTKRFEMKEDGLCKFFNRIRTEIEKEGINLAYWLLN